MSLKFNLKRDKKYLPIILAGILLILGAETLGLWAGMDNHCYDLFFRLRGPAEPDNRILIAAIDEHTLEKLGRWPLDRRHYARLLERLDRAKIVGLDILMVEPSPDDATLARAIGKHGRVVLPVYIIRPLEISGTVAALSPSRMGHVHLEQDIDGVVRSVYHTLYAGGQRLPSLASVIHETLTGKTLARQDPTGAGRDRTTQARIIQMDPWRINYYGPPGSFPRLSAVDIIDGRYPADFFEGRIVLVGITAAGLEAGVLTPFTQQRDRMSGVEVHAHILGNLIDRSVLGGASGPLRWTVSMALAVLGLLLFLWRGVGRAAMSWGLALAAVATASLAALILFDVWFSPILPGILLSFMFVVSYVYRLEQTGRQLDEAKQAWEESFHAISSAIVLADRDGAVIRMNGAARTLLAPHLLDLLARRCLPARGNPEQEQAETGSDPLPRDITAPEEIFDPLTDRNLEIRSYLRFDPQGSPIGFVHVVRDITVRVKAEEERGRLQFQLFQAQKMQSIGRLAGGVAHDFNNILTAIVGYSEMALLKLSASDPVRDHVRIIHEAGLKAAALTRQLLAFSRKQVMELQVVNLREIVEGMARLLGRIIGEDVTLKLRLEEPLRNVLADPVHMEQILMNLAVNARDAMPRGGTIAIETAEVELDEAYASVHREVAPGPYVMLAVSDTGDGMCPEVQARIFEPFFTTKKVGEGTGLGLSTVYGIVKQMSGHIEVQSELGKGSVFRVYLPVCPEDAARKTGADASGMLRGTETILIAEDEPSVRKLVADILEPLGYRVLTARSGQEALKLAEASGAKVDLLLTDVVMPGMGGKELAKRLQEIRPGIKVLFMSGYTEEIILRHGVEQEGVAFIQKPLVPSKLTLKLREVLDSR